jgi:hypothetical protein
MTLGEALGQLVDRLAIDEDKPGLRRQLVEAADELDNRTDLCRSRLVTHGERFDMLATRPAAKPVRWWTRLRWWRIDRRAL